MEQRSTAAKAGQLERQTQHLRDALGKLYALCAMYQDMDFLLRPIIEDLEKHVGEAQRAGDGISSDAGGGLPRLTFTDAEVD